MKLIMSQIIVIVIVVFSCSQSRKGDNIQKINKIQVEENRDYELFNISVIDTIKVQDKSWELLSAYSCKECDDNISLYIRRIDVPDNDFYKSPYSYPSKVYYYEDNTLIYDGRTFYGKCLDDSNKSIVWIQEEGTDDGNFKKSVYTIEFSKSGTKEKTYNYSKKLEETVLNQVLKSACIEIKQITLTSEP